ncbi:RNA polymerase sigma factor [Actinokineospora sp. UTMC 2448]|uniref:RNA polymerase sigma factor n=1 Tax=Actinokineospora sp. UTMC 2448 TaxID=2268449 RepID=UPI0021643CD6|nr:sigma-70 family RNA polymerase sigma factor [Actinokineospora sp. UTMC 2448]UVS82341.1 RNA polymerase sigma factor [Actinokineospora sp. UTMC 2448]
MTELHTVGTNPPWEGLAGSERYAACMIAARDGDKRALDVLIAELTPLVWHVARGTGLDHGTAEDVVQSVWLALLRHLERLSEPRALAGWLITTTRREANRVRQRMAAQTELLPEYAEQLPSGDPLPETLLLRGERDDKLWAAFRKLPERCQMLLRLTVLAGRAEYREVAAALGMPHGSIGPTRGRCLKSLRGLYEDGDGAR